MPWEEAAELGLFSLAVSAGLHLGLLLPFLQIIFGLLGMDLAVRLGGRQRLAVTILLDEESLARASGVVVLVGVGSWVAYRLCQRYLGPRFVRSLLLLDDGAPTPSKMRRRASLPELRPKTEFADSLDLFADDEWSSDAESTAGSEDRIPSRGTESTWVPFETTEVGTQLAEWLQSDRRPCRGLVDLLGEEKAPPNRLRPRLPPSPLVTASERHSASPTFLRRAGREADRLRCCATASPSHGHSASPLLLRQLNRRAAPIRTSALDIGEAARECAGESSDDAWSTQSPPPIRRRGFRGDESSLPPRSGSVASRTSVAVSFWEEPLFTPGSTGEEALSESEALLIILGPRTQLKERSQSPAPSEMSLPTENRLLGVETVTNMASLEGDITEVMKDSAELSTDFGILSARLGDCRDLYRSVLVCGSELGSEASFDLGLSRLSMSPAPAEAATPTRPAFLSRREEEAAVARRRLAPSSLAEEQRVTLTASTASSALVDSAIWTDPGSASDGSEVPSDPKQILRGYGPSLQVTPEDPAEGFPSPQRVRLVSPPQASPPSELSMEWDLPLSLRTPCSSSGDEAAPPRKAVPGLRDLSLYSRDRFFNNAAVSGVLAKLGKSGLRSVGLGLNEVAVFPAPVAILHGLCLQAGSVFKCGSFPVVLDALSVSCRRYPCLRDWPVHDALLQTGPDTTARLRHCLERLWELHAISLAGDAAGATELLGEPLAQAAVVEALKLLMWLRAVEVYEELRYTRAAPRPFYARLFRGRSPGQLMAALGSAGVPRPYEELELALMADALGIRLQVFQLFAEKPQVGSVYPDRSEASTTVTLVQPTPRIFLPLCPAAASPLPL